MRYIYSPNVTCEEEYSPNHIYTFTGPCVVTGKPYSVTIIAENLFKFRQTDEILDTGLDEDGREFVISGTTPEGWKQLFG